MTTQERNTLLNRAGNLARRNFAIAMNIENHQGTPFGEILQEIHEENQAEHDRINKLCNTKREYLFNFIGGGWNSAWGLTKEEAIKAAKEQYTDIDEKTFRVSTPADYANLLSLFH